MELFAYNKMKILAIIIIGTGLIFSVQNLIPFLQLKCSDDYANEMSEAALSNAGGVKVDIKGCTRTGYQTSKDVYESYGRHGRMKNYIYNYYLLPVEKENTYLLVVSTGKEDEEIKAISNSKMLSYKAIEDCQTSILTYGFVYGVSDETKATVLEACGISTAEDMSKVEIISYGVITEDTNKMLKELLIYFVLMLVGVGFLIYVVKTEG